MSHADARAIANELGKPRLSRTGFQTFRHWKATALYHETHGPVLVKEFLGHRTLDTTLLYIRLEKALLKEESNGFTMNATKDLEEIHGLLAVGFE